MGCLKCFRRTFIIVPAHSMATFRSANICNGKWLIIRYWTTMTSAKIVRYPSITSCTATRRTTAEHKSRIRCSTMKKIYLIFYGRLSCNLERESRFLEMDLIFDQFYYISPNVIAVGRQWQTKSNYSLKWIKWFVLCWKSNNFEWRSCNWVMLLSERNTKNSHKDTIDQW